MAQLIDLKIEEFDRALTALESVINRDDIAADILRDSALLRFEFTTERTWKTLKEYLAEKGGQEASVPKMTYREALRLRLLTPEETETLLAMVDDRNRLAHDYSESFSKGLFTRVKENYAPLLRKLLNSLR